MANTVQISIEALNKFDKAFNDLKTQLGHVTGEVKKISGGLDGATSSTQGLLKGFMGLYAAKQVFDVISASIRESLTYLGKMETSALGIAASFLTQGQYIDQTTGKALRGQQALTAAQEDTKGVMKELQIANFETIATLDQLVRAYQETLPVAMSKGFNRQQVQDYTKAVVQAAGALGVQLDMLGEETRSMLTGTINPRTSRIATALGITNEDIRAAKGDANKLFEFLMAKLEGFRTAGIASQTTWNGLWSNMKDMALMVGGQVLEPLFNTIKGALTDIQKKIMDVDEATGKVKGFNPEFLENIKKVRTVLGWIVADLIGVVATFDIVGTKIGEQAHKIAYRAQHPIKSIKDMYFGDGEKFPESAVGDKAAYYADLINGALGRNEKKETDTGSPSDYKPNKPKPDPEAAEKAAKLKATWDKTSRDLATDIGQINVNEFDKKIADYENKAVDLREKFKGVKGAADEIAKWLSGMKGNELAKYEKANNEAVLKASTDAAKERYTVIEASERFITERMKTELQKRINEEEKAGQEQIGKLAGALAAYEITEEEYDTRSAAIREASKKRQLQITQDYNRQILEAETNHKLNILNAAEKNMTMSKEDVTRGRIAAQTTLLSAYNAELQRSIENNDTLARVEWQEKIDATNASLTEQNRLLKEQTGTFQGGLIEGIREYTYNMQTAFQSGKQAVQSMTSAMSSGLETFFDYTSDKFLDFRELALSVLNDIYKELVKSMIINPAVGAISKGLGSVLSNLFGGGGNPTIDFDTSGGVGGGGSVIPSAKGNVFSASGLKPYLNTIVSKPTIFKFAHGVGMMGENGPEAIVPLGRNASGELGLKSAGAVAPSVQVNVINQTTKEVDAEQGEMKFDGRKMILDVVLKEHNNNPAFRERMRTGRP